jgi:hypothetical protein
MNLWDDPEIAGLLQRIVVRGCARYRRVFASAGWECETGPGIDRSGDSALPMEIYHEFLLHLVRKRVTLDGVSFPKAYFSKVFRNFAEDVRERVERSGLIFGDLEADGDRRNDHRDGATTQVAKAVREWEINSVTERKGIQEVGVGESLRRLGDFSERDQLNGLLENYPLVRDSEPLTHRLRTLYKAIYDENFPEEEADELWETARADESGQLHERLEFVKAAMSRLRQRRAELQSRGDEEEASAMRNRLAALQLREAEIADRHAYLLRLKPSHILRILPPCRRPTLNALTVALHRSRERLEACG